MLLALSSIVYFSFDKSIWSANLLVDSAIVSNFFNTPLLITQRNGEYSNLTLSTLLGLIPKWVSVNFSYLSMSPEDNADIFA